MVQRNCGNIMHSSRSSTPDFGYYKIPPIITTEADRLFLNEVNTFIDSELAKINHLDEEERYLVYKTVFNKVIEHVTAYKPVLVQIKKEYEETIETIKKGQREATFLQEKLKAMASEPSTLRNYRKRADELEERITILKKKNEQVQQEIQQIKLLKEEKEKRPKTAETPERQLKKDSRLIPGLSIEDSTDMKILHKKYETLDRQVKELSLSLRARFLPKTHKLQLKESLDNKVAYRDQLLWQSQVYKARGQRLKIALEAAQAYNQMKPPHQTVGDAVTIAFQQASGMLKAEREKTEGEQADTAQSSTFEDDDPNKEKEAEMMLEYIEKFNELFEDGLFEEAAVHAANSPKGILRTQATLAKFRDVNVKSKSRSPLLAFCDSIMSSVKAAGTKPNEALSMDCMEACLKENRLDLAYHWLSQDRLTQSIGLGKIISKHCSCPLPCKCSCQALAQSVFAKLKCHQDVVLTMLKQGKIQGALQYGRQRQCIKDENIAEILHEICDESLVNGLMEGDLTGNKCLSELNFGSLLLVLVEMNRINLVADLIQNMLRHTPIEGDATTGLLSLETAVMLDKTTTSDEWMSVMEALNNSGYQDTMFQLLAMTFVVDAMQKAYKSAQEDKREVSFLIEAPATCEQFGDDLSEEDDSSEEDKLEQSAKESSVGLSSPSRDTNSMDHSSRETSPEIIKDKHVTKGSILKKKISDRSSEQQNISSPECTPRKSVRKRGVRIAKNKGVRIDPGDKDNTDDDDLEEDVEKKKVSVNFIPSEQRESRVKFNQIQDEVCDDKKDDDEEKNEKKDVESEELNDKVDSKEKEEEKNVLFEDSNEKLDCKEKNEKKGVSFEGSTEDKNEEKIVLCEDANVKVESEEKNKKGVLFEDVTENVDSKEKKGVSFGDSAEDKHEKKSVLFVDQIEKVESEGKNKSKDVSFEDLKENVVSKNETEKKVVSFGDSTDDKLNEKKSVVFENVNEIFESEEKNKKKGVSFEDLNEYVDSKEENEKEGVSFERTNEKDELENNENSENRFEDRESRVKFEVGLNNASEAIVSEYETVDKTREGEGDEELNANVTSDLNEADFKPRVSFGDMKAEIPEGVKLDDRNGDNDIEYTNEGQTDRVILDRMEQANVGEGLPANEDESEV